MLYLERVARFTVLATARYSTLSEWTILKFYAIEIGSTSTAIVY